MGSRIKNTKGADLQAFLGASSVGLLVTSILLFKFPERGPHILGFQWTVPFDAAVLFGVCAFLLVLAYLLRPVKKDHQMVRETGKGLALHQGPAFHFNPNFGRAEHIHQGPRLYRVNTGSVWTADSGCVSTEAVVTVHRLRDTRKLGATPHDRAQSILKLQEETKASLRSFLSKTTTAQARVVQGSEFCLPGFDLNRYYQEQLDAQVSIRLVRVNVLTQPQAVTPVVQSAQFHKFMEALIASIQQPVREEVVPVVDLTKVVPAHDLVPAAPAVHAIELPQHATIHTGGLDVEALTDDAADAVIDSLRGELPEQQELEACVDHVPVVAGRLDSVHVDSVEETTIPGGLPEFEPLSLSLASVPEVPQEDAPPVVTPLALLAASATGLPVTVTASALARVSAGGAKDAPKELDLRGIDPVRILQASSDTQWDSIHDSRRTVRLSLDDDGHPKTSLALVSPVPGAARFPLTWRHFSDASSMSVSRLEQLEALLMAVQDAVVRHKGNNAMIVDEVLGGNQTLEDSPVKIAGGEANLLRCIATMIFNWKAAPFAQKVIRGGSISLADHPTIPDNLNASALHLVPSFQIEQFRSFDLDKLKEDGPVNYGQFRDYEALSVTVPGKLLELMSNVSVCQQSAGKPPKAANG